MRHKKHLLPIVIACLICLNCGPSSLNADEGHPVAIRFWPEQAVTIETMWNLHVGLGNNVVKEGLPRIPDMVLRMNQVPSIDGKMTVRIHGWSASHSNEFVLDRKPNEEEIAWSTAGENSSPSANAVRISRIPVELATAENQPTLVSLIVIDGVRIVDTGGATAESLLTAMKTNSAATESILAADAILFTAIIPNADSLQSIADMFHPRIIVIPAGCSFDSVGNAKVRVVTHNTLAASASKTKAATETEFVSLGDAPCQMGDDMAELYARKEAACRISREVFAPLSVEQMNFVPGDGSHTPRWNAEHMMGRELGFFSGIYHNFDPAIPVMDLNPKQMPDQYQAAHPDWNGAEEARQTERVEAFNRRFAYLLDGVDLEGRVKGNPFRSLRALLVQMDRHYSEHTGNVEKKMKLPNWPAR